MTWKIRHQGSPRAVEGLTLADVLEGLQDGLWEPTDEVMGPTDQEWVALEDHPEFAELAADLEPRSPHHYDDETHREELEWALGLLAPAESFDQLREQPDYVRFVSRTDPSPSVAA